jgi:hypothetical protein
MKAIVVAVLLLGACVDESDDFPVIPGGGGFHSPPSGAGSASVIRGRVCLLTDLVDFSSCVSTGAGGLTVTLAESTAITAADGTFAMTAPRGARTAFGVSGLGAVTTTLPFDPNRIDTLPVIDADVWARMLASNAISLPNGTGSILGSVLRDGFPVSGVGVASSPVSAFNPLFDVGTTLGPGATGARGVFLVPGVTAGTSTLTFSPGETLVAGIPVVNGGVTILDSTLLP